MQKYITMSKLRIPAFWQNHKPDAYSFLKSHKTFLWNFLPCIIPDLPRWNEDYLYSKLHIIFGFLIFYVPTHTLCIDSGQISGKTDSIVAIDCFSTNLMKNLFAFYYPMVPIYIQAPELPSVPFRIESIPELQPYQLNNSLQPVKRITIRGIFHHTRKTFDIQYIVIDRIDM